MNNTENMSRFFITWLETATTSTLHEIEQRYTNAAADTGLTLAERHEYCLVQCEIVNRQLLAQAAAR